MVAAVLLAVAAVLTQGFSPLGGARPALAQTALTVSAGGPYTGTTASAVTMTSTVSGATSPQFIWSFGDGTTGSGQVVSHAYSTAGTLAATVTVVDISTGRSGFASTTVTGRGWHVNGERWRSLYGHHGYCRHHDRCGQ